MKEQEARDAKEKKREENKKNKMKDTMDNKSDTEVQQNMASDHEVPESANAWE